MNIINSTDEIFLSINDLIETMNGRLFASTTKVEAFEACNLASFFVSSLVQEARSFKEKFLSYQLADLVILNLSVKSLAEEMISKYTTEKLSSLKTQKPKFELETTDIQKEFSSLVVASERVIDAAVGLIAKHLKSDQSLEILRIANQLKKQF